MSQVAAIQDLINALDGDTPMFEHDYGPGRGIVRWNACPAMAYWMVKTLLWLVEEV